MHELRGRVVVTASTTFHPGHYRFGDPDGGGVIVVAADGIVLDGNGLVLDGLGRAGFGIVLRGRSGVTVRNFVVRNFFYALFAEDCSSLVIEDNDLSENAGSDDTFLDINQPLEAACGGGVLLHRVSDSVVRRNVARGQDVGINLYGSHRILMASNDVSHNTAWGIRLFASCDNRIERNQAHHVNRCGGTGCDAAGILLTSGSHRNAVVGNDLRYSGDGFFLGNQFSPPSNENLVEGNDGSYSPNNAFEATFSIGNVFRNNIATQSNYGFWLGFSRRTILEGNVIAYNRTDGVHWEHGLEGIIRDNLIASNGRHGIAFTLDPANRDVPDRVTSGYHLVSANTIRHNGRCGIYLLHTTDSTLTGNLFAGNPRDICLEGESVRNQLG
jgi:parallel beta-helix repeat protein